MKCEKCNNIVPDDSAFCSHCGNKIEKPQEPSSHQCEKCGNTLPLDSEFCHYCGNQISKAPVEEKTEYTIEKEASYTESTRLAKQKYCSKCGGLINNQTKVCESCGKQYFRLTRIFNKKNLPTIILSILLIIAIVVISALAWSTDHYFKLYGDQLQETRNLEEKYDDLVDDWVDLFGKVYFYEEYVVIVPDDGTNRYHVYGCDRLDKSDSFWAFNTEAAKVKGYKPCPYCCD